MKKLRKVFGTPLPWFLLAGAGLFILDDLNRDIAVRPIEITAGDIQRLQDRWRAQTGGGITATRLDSLIDELILERRLAREARALGLDEEDVIIQRRLAQKLTFLNADLADSLLPDEQTLRSYFAEHRGEYRQADALTFRQIFFSRKSRGEHAEGDALRILSDLQQEPSIDWRSIGDAGIVARSFVNESSRGLAKNFGDAFVEQLLLQEKGHWHGPLHSELGLHLVIVDDYVAAPENDWSELRAEVLYDYRRTQRALSFARYVDTLERKYPVVVSDERGAETGASPGATK